LKIVTDSPSLFFEFAFDCLRCGNMRSARLLSDHAQAKPSRPGDAVICNVVRQGCWIWLCRSKCAVRDNSGLANSHESPQRVGK
jgi:hypothetical protein